MAAVIPKSQPKEPTPEQRETEKGYWNIMRRGDNPAVGPERPDGSRGKRRWNSTTGEYEGDFEPATAPNAPSSSPPAVNPVPGGSSAPNGVVPAASPATTPPPPEGKPPLGPEDKARKLLENDQHWTECWTIDDMKYTTYYSTIWEVFEEMTYRHPGYVKHPRIYYRSNRMTMFFGFPDQDMWESMGDPADIFEANRLFLQMALGSKVVNKDNVEIGDENFTEWENVRQMAAKKNVSMQTLAASDSLEGSSKAISQTIYNMLKETDGKGYNLVVNANLASRFVKTVRNRKRPFRRWHNVNSYTDIINNTIEATADGWFTEVNIQFGGDSIGDDIATDAFQKSSAGTENPNVFINWKDDNIVTRRATIDLSPAFLRSTHYQFVNIKRKAMAQRYARSILAKQAKEMYKGSLLVMGNPYIRPYDVIMVNDTYSNIFGPIEVEEVHHMFGVDTGFVTHIYPDTLVVNDDVTPYMLHNAVYNEAWMKTEMYSQNALLQRPLYGSTEGLVNTSILARQLKKLYDTYENQSLSVKYEMESVSKLWSGDGFQDLSTAAGLAGVAAGAGSLIGLYGFGGLKLAQSIPKIGDFLFGASLTSKRAGFFAAVTSFGVGLSLYAKLGAQFQSFIMNYVADSRAYFMIPLMKEGVPLAAGINIGFGSGIYKTPLQYIKQYFMDGGIGLATREVDMLMNHNEIRSNYGSNISWWLRFEQDFESFKEHWDKKFLNFGRDLGEQAGLMNQINPAAGATITGTSTEYIDIQKTFDENPQSPNFATSNTPQ